jgi:hypothetical protein
MNRMVGVSMGPDIKEGALKAEPKAKKRLSPQGAKLIFIIVLTVSLFFLAHSMVRHYFFSGGALNSQQDITRPHD